METPLLQSCCRPSWRNAHALRARGQGHERILAVAASTISLVGSLLVAWGYDTKRADISLWGSTSFVPRYSVRPRYRWLGCQPVADQPHHLRGFVRDLDREIETEFYVLLLALVAGVYEVFVSLDLFVFFLFYEIATPDVPADRRLGSTKKVAEAGLEYLFRVLDIGEEYAAMKLTLMLLLGSPSSSRESSPCTSRRCHDLLHAGA